jgi:hypothetical protein
MQANNAHAHRLLRRDQQWLLRCSVLAALAEQPSIPAAWLLELATLAIEDTDGTVRVGGAAILGRLVRDWPGEAEAHQARLLLQQLQQLQQDPDHRVVGTALNGLQA